MPIAPRHSSLFFFFFASKTPAAFPKAAPAPLPGLPPPEKSSMSAMRWASFPKFFLSSSLGSGRRPVNDAIGIP